MSRIGDPVDSQVMFFMLGRVVPHFRPRIQSVTRRVWIPLLFSSF